MPRHLEVDAPALAAALVAPFVLAAVLVPFRARLPVVEVALVLVVVVVAVAVLGSRLAGVVAALSAALWFDFFFTRPYERFAIGKAADLETTALLLVVALAVSQLAARARRLEVVAITDAKYLSLIHDTAALTQSARSADTVVDHVCEQLGDLLGLRGCRFEYGALLGRPARLEQDGSLVVGHRRWDVDRRGLPDEEIELRTFGNGHFYGRFMLRPVPGTIPPPQARLVAVILADQAGRALDTAATARGRE
ncbi:hypothetical protein GCM10009530_06400 [Microbispora corallina]|uniref:Sensor protein KdpD transmembrane domain-containing protein n=1 Tax=Microbispora corallina TaxID=83302 RepID=A0ABQ4FUW4_9ACTN|nr:DUF4118 domain-containing protein [Microbispora corallina]GIH38603.1 hypothetical protein Mco01_16030 [Microbispora corallina]